MRISPEELSPPPDFPIRSLILVFEEENSFSPVAAGAVTVRVSEPNTLVSPAHVLTDAQGGVSVSYKPVALYEEAALKAGDLVVDYKATLYITLEKGGKIWEWELDDWLTYAYYFDPLYQGLNRTAEQGPDYINLIVTDKY